MDSRVAKKIISTADISSDDTILEIGPGRGALTRHLAETSKRLVGIELDPELASELQARFSNDPGVEIIHGDARDVSVDQFINAGERYKLLANLPYYAANRIVRRFLTAERKPSILVFMVQREVARTMAAQPGGMGLLSVMIQLYGSVKVAFTVPPRAFRPAPKSHLPWSASTCTTNQRSILYLTKIFSIWSLLDSAPRANRSKTA